MSEMTTAPESFLRARRTDRRRAEPLWHQVETAIRAAIDEGVLAAGTQLPREARLSELLGASRITVRHALSNLETLGLIRRDHGRGTFVRSPTLVAGHRGLTSFSEELAALGLHAESHLLGIDELAADASIAAALDIAEGTPVVAVRRLRLAGGEAIGLQTAHLRVDRVPALDADVLAGQSLYAVLHQHAGIEPLEALETYRVSSADVESAALLGIASGAPVFTIRRVTTDRVSPFEVTDSVMRGDRYEISARLRLLTP